MKIDFIMVFSERRELDLPAAFYLIKKMIVVEVIVGQRSVPVCISIVRVIFKCDLQRIAIFQTSKSIISYIFEQSSSNFQDMF